MSASQEPYTTSLGIVVVKHPCNKRVPAEHVATEKPPRLTRDKNDQIIWTQELKAWVAIAWNLKLSAGEIGYRLGVSKNVIIGAKNRMGLDSRPSPLSSPRRDRVPPNNIEPAGKVTLAPLIIAGLEPIIVAIEDVEAPKPKPERQQPVKRKARPIASLDEDALWDKIEAVLTAPTVIRGARPTLVPVRPSPPPEMPARRASRCQWPMDGDRSCGFSGARAKLCCDPTIAGDYCLMHARIAYRRKAAA